MDEKINEYAQKFEDLFNDVVAELDADSVSILADIVTGLFDDYTE